jgi:hypothetical protein
LTNQTFALAGLGINANIVARQRMSGFAKLAFAIANKAAFGLRVLHVVGASADEKMVRIDAKRVVAMVASIEVANLDAFEF